MVTFAPWWELAVAYSKMEHQRAGFYYYYQPRGWLPGPLAWIPEQVCRACANETHDKCPSRDGGTPLVPLPPRQDGLIMVGANDWRCSCPHPSHDESDYLWSLRIQSEFYEPQADR